MTTHLDETLVYRILHLPSRARAVLLAAYTTGAAGAGCFRCDTTRRHLSQATGLSSSTIGRALRDIRRSRTPGITVTRRSTPDAGDEGVTIIVEGA